MQFAIEYNLRLVQNPMFDGADLFIFRRNNMAGTMTMFYQNGDTIEEKEVQINGTYPPTLRLDRTQLQQLVDELQRMNIKPKDAGKTEGLLEAQSEHLKDLRKLLKLP